MSPHFGSAHREDAVRYLDAMTDGVCLAIDHLRAMGHDTHADALFARLFAPAPGSPPPKSTYSTAPEAPPEEHILP